MNAVGEALLLSRLAKSSRALIAGAGGGFDIYAGLPLALALIIEAFRHDVEIRPRRMIPH